MAISNSLQLADVVVMVMEAGAGTDHLGEELVTCLNVQGMPAVCGIVLVCLLMDCRKLYTPRLTICV